MDDIIFFFLGGGGLGNQKMSYPCLVNCGGDEAEW